MATISPAVAAKGHAAVDGVSSTTISPDLLVGLHPPRMPPWERILAMGLWGRGKSYAWLQIANWAAKTRSPAQFYVIDTDAAIERMLWSEEFVHLADRVHVRAVFDWGDYESALGEFAGLIRPCDWLILDQADGPWETVQRYFVEEIFSKDIGSYFLDARRDLETRREQAEKSKAKGKKEPGLKNLQPMEGWVDWVVIKKIYNLWMGQLIYRSRCHVFAATKEEKVTDEDNTRVQQEYGEVGFKPRGEKSLGYQFHTVLRLHGSNSNRRLTSCKDRQRRVLDAEPWKDFVLTYLVKTAGWKLR